MFFAYSHGKHFKEEVDSGGGEKDSTEKEAERKNKKGKSQSTYWNLFSVTDEFEHRLGDGKVDGGEEGAGNVTKWSCRDINKGYDLCPSYPKLFYCPTSARVCDTHT